MKAHGWFWMLLLMAPLSAGEEKAETPRVEPRFAQTRIELTALP